MRALRNLSNRRRAVLAGLAVTLGVASWSSAATAATYVYWGGASGSDIWAAGVKSDGSKDGATQTVVTPAGWAYGTAADTAGGALYWVDSGVGLMKAGLDGSTPDALPNTLAAGGARGLGFAPGTGNLVWADEYVVGTANAGSGGTATLYRGKEWKSALGDPSNAVADPASGMVYWADDGATTTRVYPTFQSAPFNGAGPIRRTSLSGTCDAAADPDLDYGYASGIAVDRAHGKVYLSGVYYDTASNSFAYVVQAALDGTGCTTMWQSADTYWVYGLAVDPDSQTVYFADSDKGAIRYVKAATPGTAEIFDDVTSSTPAWPMMVSQPSPSATLPATAPVGSVLACQVNWNGSPASSFYREPASASYSWSLNGTAISGATAATYTAPLAGSYTCTVTGTNYAGSGSATSNAVTVAAGTTPAPVVVPPTVKVKKTTRTIGSSKITLKSSVLVNEAGKITQKAVRRGGKKQTLCTTSRKVNGPGTFSLTCTMGSAVRNQLRKGAIKYTLVTKITTASGASSSTSSTGTLPKSG